MRQECTYCEGCDREATLEVTAEIEWVGPLTGETKSRKEVGYVCFDHYHDVKDNAEQSEEDIELSNEQI